LSALEKEPDPRAVAAAAAAAAAAAEEGWLSGCRKRPRKEEAVPRKRVRRAPSPLLAPARVRKVPVRRVDEAQEEEELACGICFERVEDRGKLDACEHVFCFACIVRWFERSCRCPFCKRVVTAVKSSTAGIVTKVAQKELKETLDLEDEESDEDIHDFMDTLAVFARSLGISLNYQHRTDMDNRNRSSSHRIITANQRDLYDEDPGSMDDFVERLVNWNSMRSNPSWAFLTDQSDSQ